jgi:HK97 family phage portal protein
MAFVQTLDGLEMVQPWWSPGPIRTSIRLYDRFHYDYATLYRLQPNMRTCVEFLARNIAHLGLHVFRRLSGTDRERLTDHSLAQLIKRPLPARYKTTRYRLINALVSDLGIYFNAYWLKIKREGQLGLLRIPPEYVLPLGNLVPSEYEVTIGARMRRFGPDDLIHFWGYNPENPVSGLAPAETLRRILAEEHAAGDYREGFWQNSARITGIIERPAEAPEWHETARERFVAEFEELYSGGDNSGKTAVLEEGMKWKPNAFNPQESEYLGGRKLTREECARAYHIPPPLVGILDHATFSNIREQHKHLYQDTLGPWLSMIEQDIELQLLEEFEDSEGVYIEFNIAEKLKGDFEDQAKALQSAVGRPWLTADEARGVMNRPGLGGDADQLVTPLNVIVGGQASPRDSGQRGQPPPERKVAAGHGAKGIDSHAPALRERHQQKWVEFLARHYRRQEAAIVSRVPASGVSAPGKSDIGGVWWDDERWNSELATDLLGLNQLTAMAWAERLAEQLESEVSEDPMLPYLREHSRVQAEQINARTRDAVSEALTEEDPTAAVKGVFSQALASWAVRQADSAVLAAANFGSNEAARVGGLNQKTWRTNSANPRDAHKALSGETVGLAETFSNRMRWPGDPVGGAENNANCKCSVEFSRSEQ